MSELANKSCNVVKNFIRLTHFSVHGFRKGSGTHASSATTCPPLFTSIAARGKWSMGKVLDVYFQFAASGDHYLGQLLSLKDPNSVDFDTPCPQWIDPSHPAVMQALELTLGQFYWSIVILPMTLKVLYLYSWHLWCIIHLGCLV
jgi:hypothetical protein